MTDDDALTLAEYVTAHGRTAWTDAAIALDWGLRQALRARAAAVDAGLLREVGRRVGNTPTDLEPT